MVFNIISSILLMGLALLLLRREGLGKKTGSCLAMIFLALTAVALRLSLFAFESDDYLSFLRPWTEYFRMHGGFGAFSALIGNYNPPYMYFLALFSYFDFNELYGIKLLSVIFDILLAWSSMKLLSLFCESKLKQAVCFFAVLLLPTVLFNSSYWGQCDSIYSFFAVFSLYLALSGRGTASMFALAASLAFKLQAVFIMPVFLILVFARKLKLRQLFVFPLAYALYMLPAVIAGMPLWDALTVYFSQIGTVGDAMNYNAPSLTAFVSWSGDTEKASRLLIIAAFLLVLLGYLIALIFRKRLSDRALFAFALFLTLGIPYLLPHMHDRYFYCGAVLLIVMAADSPLFSPALICAELASLHCYYAYFRRFYLVSPSVGALLMLFALVLTLGYLAHCLYLESAESPRLYKD